MSNIPPPVELTEDEAKRYGYDPARTRQSDPLPPDTDDYVFLPEVWPNRPGRTITWSNWSGDLGETLESGRGRDDVLDEGLTAAQLTLFRQQAAKWEAVLDVTLSEVSDSASNNLRIGITNEEDGTQIAAVRRYTNSGVTVAQALFFHANFITHQAVLSGIVSLHEIGHVLGLGHCPNAVNIMRGTPLGSSAPVLQTGDKNGGRHLYGPDETLTDTDSIYRLSSSAPSTPSGGTSDEDHLPSGWSRTAPSPTQTLDVYRSQRTRSYTNGVFTSATAWGTPALFAELLNAAPAAPIYVDITTTSFGVSKPLNPPSNAGWTFEREDTGAQFPRGPNTSSINVTGLDSDAEYRGRVAWNSGILPYDVLISPWSPYSTVRTAAVTYDFRHREVGTPTWTTVEDIDALTYLATGLDPSTDYEAQVKAKNDAGESDWSLSGTGTTNAASVARLLIAAEDAGDLYEIDPDGANSQGDLLRALPSGLTEPQAMTSHDGRLLIVDADGSDLYEIDPDGADAQGGLLRALPSGLTNPRGMTSHDGRLLIADADGDELYEIDPDGAGSQGDLLRDLPSGLTFPGAMTSHDGRLLIADDGGDELYEIDPDGANSQGDLLRDLPAGLQTPVSMASHDGRLLIADANGDELHEIDPDGANSQGDDLRDFPALINNPSGMTSHAGS